MITRQILIKGKVQGVFYRASAKKIAEQLALSGWVRNTKDGDVQATVTGDDDAVAKFIDWCNKGPEKAVVKDVAVTILPLAEFSNFSILRE